MANRTHNEDFKDVMQAAEEAITAALQDGQHKYDAGAWLTHSVEEHLNHAGAHLEDLLETDQMPANEEFRTALAHLICRAVMAWARQQQSHG
jgi:exonuclease VII small subunit